MTSLDIPAFEDGSLRIDVTALDDDAAVLRFDGVLGYRDPTSILQPLFTELHRAAVERHVAEVQVDMRQLRSMNSSSLKHFIAWLKANSTLPAEARYRIRFLLDPASHWQSMSIRALACFAADAIT